MGCEVGVIVRGLQDRRTQIVEEICTRVCAAVPELTVEGDLEYARGLRDAVEAAVDYGLAGIERGGHDAAGAQRLDTDIAGSEAAVGPEEAAGSAAAVALVPEAALVQARRAARSAVSLEGVLQRYFVGHALLWDHVMREAERVGCGGASLREISRAQSGQLQRLTSAIAHTYTRERERVTRSREQRLADTVRALLTADTTPAGDGPSAAATAGALALVRERGYELEREHVAAIIWGPPLHEASALLGELAGDLSQRPLVVRAGVGTTWAWLGSTRRGAIDMATLARAARALVHHHGHPGSDPTDTPPAASALGSTNGAGLCIALGEPAWGFEGWRATHRQARAALAVAVQQPGRTVTRYTDVALLANAIKDPLLASALIETYIDPLDGAPPKTAGGSARAAATGALRQTLSAYLQAGRNVASTAAALNVSRRTVEYRLHTIEDRLGRSLHPCPPELQIALQLAELATDE
ncbi:MAG TPA: helix-turn-helix domain-containing protein [Solirubrobacteraceae bacterium]